MDRSWQDEQEWERKWHGNCINSFWEETKQQVYAKRMGLEAHMVAGKFPIYDLAGKTVGDIGGGAYSLLLKTVNGKELTVVDPCDYPQWTKDRYQVAGITSIKESGEDYKTTKVFDEVWLYNCLQHTINPQKIISNMRSYSKIIRVFEWIDTPITDGHPHSLSEIKLNLWLGGVGKTEDMKEAGCYGRAYYGVFLGKHYGEV